MVTKTVEIGHHVQGVKTHTRQSIGLPTALPGAEELEGGGERPRAASPDPGRAVGNPIDCRVCAFTPGTVLSMRTHTLYRSPPPTHPQKETADYAVYG